MKTTLFFLIFAILYNTPIKSQTQFENKTNGSKLSLMLTSGVTSSINNVEAENGPNLGIEFAYKISQNFEIYSGLNYQYLDGNMSYKDMNMDVSGSELWFYNSYYDVLYQRYLTNLEITEFQIGGRGFLEINNQTKLFGEFGFSYHWVDKTYFSDELYNASYYYLDEYNYIENGSYYTDIYYNGDFNDEIGFDFGLGTEFSISKKISFNLMGKSKTNFQYMQLLGGVKYRF